MSSVELNEFTQKLVESYEGFSHKQLLAQHAKLNYLYLADNSKLILLQRELVEAEMIKRMEETTC